MAEQTADGAAAAMWLGGDDCTFRDALVLGADVREQAANVLPSLGRRDATRHFPASMSDALSLVHAREDAKRKNTTSKMAKGKHKSLVASHIGTDTHFPGAKEGGGDASAFWMYLEDFFRDATQEDLHLILHLIQPPDTDPAFRVGPPGSKTDLPLPLKPAGQSAPLTSPSPGPSTTAAGSAPQHSAASGPASEWATPGQETPGSPFERRSKRLGSKLRLPGEISKYVEDDSDAMDDLTDEPDVKTDPALVAAAAASAAASAAAMTVPLVANGALATCLWDVIPDSKLASLTLEMAQLMAATGVQGPARLDAASVDAAKAAAAAPGGNGAVPLSPELRVRLRKWLEEQAAAISEQLGCKTEVPMLALRRVSAGNGNAGAISAGDGAQEGGSGGSAEVEQAPGIVVALPSAGYFHPYTDLMLGSKVPEHVRRAGTDPLPPDPTLATRTPAVNALGPAQTGDLAGLATPTASLAGGAADASNAGVTDGPAASDLSGLEDGNDSGADHSMGVVQSAGGRSAGRQRSGMNYALMAGRKDPIKAAAAAEARKQVRAATAAMEAEAAAQHPVAVAVAAAVAAGASEGPANEQWAVATRDMRLLAVAPQDEIAAETLALQAELAAVAAANRNRVIPALRALLEDIPRQKEAAEVREQERVEVESWIKGVLDAEKRRAKVRREAAHRDALVHAGAQKGPDGLSSPGGRPVLGRGPSGEEGSPNDTIVVEAPFLGPDELYDVLAQRREEDEAFCAVCGDGSSMEPNVILFCDRCDVAVHQRCYDVDTVPTHEWLCWPCKEYEEAQRAAGVPQDEIRPRHMMPEERKQLKGGARDVKCALCPIKCGAYRKTVDGQHWVHQTCALWHTETYLVPGAGPNVVEGVSRIPAKRWTRACDICGRTEGAVMNCQHPGTCQYAFHVLCARNCGLYLTCRKDFQGRPQYRIYCALHSRGQQEKDLRALAHLMEGHQKPTTAAQEKAARNEQKQAALAALADKEAELQQMSSLRINLEHCRMLMDLCKRREKLKKQLAVATAAAYAERLQHPAQALEFMETLRQFETEGLTPGQQLELIFGADGMDSYLMPPPPVLQIAPPPGQRSGRTTPRLMSGALPDEDEGSQGRVRRTTGPLTSKRQRGEAPEFPGLTHTPAVAPVDLGQAKRARRGGATPPPPGFADGAVGGASPPIQMAMMLNSHEAQKLNQQLPPKIKFVPSHTLLQQAGSGGLDAAEGSDGGATRRARAERAAARGGPGEGEDSGTGGGGRIRYRG